MAESSCPRGCSSPHGRGAHVLQPDGAEVHADADGTEDAEPQHSIHEGHGLHDHLP